jgi:hypothetical protein
VGDISASMNFANMHPYPFAGTPTHKLASTKATLHALNGRHAAWWATEAGYYTAPDATKDVYQPGVSEAAQGKYIPRLYLDFFDDGISHTAVYELIDEGDDRTDAELNYGLLHYDGSPKPAFTALTNLISILSDRGTSFAPGALTYGVTGSGSNVRDLLLQKRDGHFYIVLWNDVPSYAPEGERALSWRVRWRRWRKAGAGSHDLQVPPVRETLHLDRIPHAVTMYMPLGKSGDRRSLQPDSAIAVDVPDHPVVVEITP